MKIQTFRMREGDMKSISSQRGLTLVELMVAMTIGLFLIGAVGMIYVNTTTSSRAGTLESQMNEDAALALELLQQQIRLAGFSGIDTDGARRFSGVGVRGCDEGFQRTGSDGLATNDNDGATAFNALTCSTPTPTGQGPDALAIRYEATSLNSQTVADGTPGNCSHQGIAAWNAIQEGGTDNVALADNRYYIANETFTTAVNGSTVQTVIPSLFCRGRNGAGFSNATALIPNIEDMQIMYGVTSLPQEDEPFPNQITAYVEAGDTVLNSLPSDSPADISRRWSRVIAIRVCLLARSANPIPLGDNAVGKAAQGTNDMQEGLGTYVNCNGTKVTNSDRYLRRAYVTTIQLRNTRPALPAAFDGGGRDPWRSPDEEQ